MYLDEEQVKIQWLVKATKNQNERFNLLDSKIHKEIINIGQEE